MNWIWPKITNIREAEEATAQAAVWAFIVCAVTGLIGTIAFFQDHPIFGLDGGALFDAILFAVVGWRILRFSFAWAVAGLCLLTAEVLWTISNGGHSGVLNFVEFCAFLAGIRGTWFLRKKPKTNNPSGATASRNSAITPSVSTGPNSSPESVETLAWMPDLKRWMATRLSTQDLHHVATEVYRAYQTDTVHSLRCTVLTNDEFSATCKTAAKLLLFRAQLFIAGATAAAQGDEILASMLAVFPEYQSFYKSEDIFRDFISLKDFAKLQMFESEMYGVIHTYLSGDSEWFAEAVPKLAKAAEEFWVAK